MEIEFSQQNELGLDMLANENLKFEGIARKNLI